MTSTEGAPKRSLCALWSKRPPLSPDRLGTPVTSRNSLETAEQDGDLELTSRKLQSPAFHKHASQNLQVRKYAGNCVDCGRFQSRRACNFGSQRLNRLPPLEIGPSVHPLVQPFLLEGLEWSVLYANPIPCSYLTSHSTIQAVDNDTVSLLILSKPVANERGRPYCRRNFASDEGERQELSVGVLPPLDGTKEQRARRANYCPANPSLVHSTRLLRRSAAPDRREARACRSLHGRRGRLARANLAVECMPARAKIRRRRLARSYRGECPALLPGHPCSAN